MPHTERKTFPVLETPSAETPSVVVFTAQFGRFDVVMPPSAEFPGATFVVLTDERLRVPEPWTVRHVTLPLGLTDPRLKNRWCKMHASELLADFDVSIYVDTHVQVVGDLRPLLDEFIRSGASLGILRHPHSHSVEQEVERSLRTGRISEEDHTSNWARQLERHRVNGFTDDLGVYYATVVMRRHRSPLLRELEDAWWLELTQGVLRDQVALPFALWRTGVPHQVFLLPWSLAPFFRRWGHLPRWTMRQRMLRQLDCRVEQQPGYRWALRILRAPEVARSIYRLIRNS